MDGLEFDSSETEVEEYAEELREIERKQKMREEAKKRLEEKRARQEEAERRQKEKRTGVSDILKGVKDWIKEEDWFEEEKEDIDDNTWIKTKKKYIWTDGDDYYNTKENICNKIKKDYFNKKYDSLEYKSNIYDKIIYKEKYK